MATHSYHHEDLKTELIQKGLAVLSREGYEGLSLRKVAKACGVSQTAPYRHFKDKDELVAAITMHAIKLFDFSLKQAAKKYAGAEEQLKEMGVAYVHFFVANPKYLKLLFFSNIQDYIGKNISGGHAQTESGNPFSTFLGAVKTYKESKPEETRSVDELALCCWGLVHGMSVLISSGQSPCGKKSLATADSIIRSGRFLI